jgi:hypothetical protein
MRLAASIDLYSYGCPCNDGKSGMDYHNLLESHGYSGKNWGETGDSGAALKRKSSDTAGTVGHLITYDARTGSWEHQDPSEKITKGIGYDSLKKHLEGA